MTSIPFTEAVSKLPVTELQQTIDELDFGQMIDSRAP